MDCKMEIKDKLVFRIACILGGLTVVLGSLEAHAIEFATAKLQNSYHTAVFYQGLHVPVLLFLALTALRKEALLMTAGIIAFCWSLFLKGATGIDPGMMIPLGGMALILAWLWLTFAVHKKEV